MSAKELRTGFNLFADLIKRRYGVHAEVVKHTGDFYVAGPTTAFDNDGHRLCVHGWYGEGGNASEALRDFWAKHKNDPDTVPVRSFN